MHDWLLHSMSQNSKPSVMIFYSVVEEDTIKWNISKILWWEREAWSRESTGTVYTTDWPFSRKGYQDWREFAPLTVNALKTEIPCSHFSISQLNIRSISSLFPASSLVTLLFTHYVSFSTGWITLFKFHFTIWYCRKQGEVLDITAV